MDKEKSLQVKDIIQNYTQSKDQLLYVFTNSKNSLVENSVISELKRRCIDDIQKILELSQGTNIVTNPDRRKLTNFMVLSEHASYLVSSESLNTIFDILSKTQNRIDHVPIIRKSTPIYLRPEKSKLTMINEQLGKLKTLLKIPNHIKITSYTTLQEFEKIDTNIIDIIDELNQQLKKNSDLYCIVILDPTYAWCLPFLRSLYTMFQSKLEKKAFLDAQKPTIVVNKNAFKKKSRYIPKNPKVVVLRESLFPPKAPTFDTLVSEADKYFDVGGPTLLDKAKIIYQDILQKFPNDPDISYVENQLKIIENQLELFLKPSDARPETNNNSSHNKETIDLTKYRLKPGTGSIEDDFA